MIVKSLNDVISTEFDVDWGNGKSRRFLTLRDGMGYSLTETIVNAGSDSLLEYKNHLEACYCIEGEGEVRDTTTGAVHQITPGTMYALDKHEKHHLVAKSDMKLVCVFNPPLKGTERHNLKDAESSTY
ncbi:MAG TPA: ectoine synthase [Burkholderiales bacterium]|nr:ectoine synthase [Burkholderiales bacterium]